jgi:hypothetical protein
MRRYRRFFTMFELEDKNFSIFTGEESRGYAKVEIKNSQGLLSIYCQGLKSSNGNRYQWYLIDTKTDGEPTIVEIGPMEVDERGKGEKICEFNAANVKGSMIQIDDFNILALIAQNRDQEDKLYAPLVGYIDRERPDVSYWRYALGKYLHIPIDEGTTKEKMAQFYRPAKKVEEKPVKETKKEITEEMIKEPVEEVIEEPAEEEKEIEEKVVEEAIEEPAKGIVEEIEIIEGVVEEKVAEEAAEQIVEESTGEFVEKVIEEPAEEEKEIEEKVIEEVTEEAPEGITEELAKEAEKEVVEEAVKETAEEVTEDEYEIQMQAYIENSLKGFIEVEPFIENLKNYIWWQIPYDVQTMYRAYMPFISYLDSLREPMDQADYYVSRMAQIVYVHQHHIFGICYDTNNRARYYAYGILGRNLSMEQPFELDEDFVYWHPCDNVPANIESYGYWILTIDPKTGDAVKCK